MEKYAVNYILMFNIKCILVQGLQLVNYLKVYNRHNPPSDYELSSVVKQKDDVCKAV